MLSQMSDIEEDIILARVGSHLEVVDQCVFLANSSMTLREVKLESRTEVYIFVRSAGLLDNDLALSFLSMFYYILFI